MPLVTGDPFEPIDCPGPGTRPKPLRWWQAALILAPFAAAIVYMTCWVKW